MLKRNLSRIAVLAAAVICMSLLSACGGNIGNGESGDPTAENAGKTPTPEISETEKEPSAPVLPETEAEPEKTSDPSAAPETETEPEEPAEPSEPETIAEPEPTVVPTEPVSDPFMIAKINGGADEVGIYSVTAKLTDKAADKGTLEMVYLGAKGSPQENSIVNTFRIEYYKEEAGTYEIRTFFDGETYQNYHHKNEVKVTNTFSANLRAGSVIISYTPDGGETAEVFRADADYFRPSKE